MNKLLLSKAFGLKIKKLRKSKRLAQKTLATAIGKSTETISNIERGVYSPRMSTVFDLAKALHVEMHELFQIRKSAMGTKEKEIVIDRIFDLLKDRPIDFLNRVYEQVNIFTSLEEQARKR
jgi:DNA-binding XRE family transcriptional regulator